ncbi:MAG: peptidase M15 [Nostocaceae cyanobacterium]|nr:peptidase M15 [Nostocaceae cyanobacterium]
MLDATGRNINLNSLCREKNHQQLPNAELTYTPKEKFLKAIADKLPTLPLPGSFEYLLLQEYGAVFVHQDPAIKLPTKVFFPTDQETKAFQSSLDMAFVNGTKCALQKPAADALNRVRQQVSISFKSGNAGADCTRTFATHARFWRKYANNKTMARLRRGQYLPILSIVAPPGASQHLWSLAIDLRITNDRQRQALYQNGWFQTVENDPPHWTYLGLSEEELLQLGFQNKVVNGIKYLLTPL